MKEQLDYQSYRTDKWKNHSYMEVYERIFDRLRDKRVKMIELGIYSGGCLLLWKDFFGKGSVIEGLDNNIASVMMDKMKEANIKIYDTFLEDWTPDHPYDIIIDDASHEAHAQARDFKRFWPYISTRGVYVIEDVNRIFYRRSHDGMMSSNDHGIQEFCDKHDIHLEKYMGQMPYANQGSGDVMYIFTHKSYWSSLKPLTIWQKIVNIFKPRKDKGK